MKYEFDKPMLFNKLNFTTESSDSMFVFGDKLNSAVNLFGVTFR